MEHSNSNIDPELTENNQSFYKDENGEWQPVRHSSQLIDSVQRRIDEVQASSKKPIRHDACIVRPIVTQFGTEDMDEEEEERLIEAQVEFMEQEFGVDNITGFAIHRDETSMHIHWLMTPVTYRIERECLSKTPVVDDDGQPVLGKDGKQKIKKKYGNPKVTDELTFTQHQFFPDKKDHLSDLHKRFRQHLIDRGFDVELENKPIEEYDNTYETIDKDGNRIIRRKGLTPEAMNEISEAKEKGFEIRNKANAHEAVVNAREKGLDRREKALNKREDDINRQQDDINRQKKELAEQQDDINRQKKELAEQQLNMDKIITQRVNEAIARRDSANEMAKGMTKPTRALPRGFECC